MGETGDRPRRSDRGLPIASDRPDLPPRSAGSGSRSGRVHREDQPDDNDLHGERSVDEGASHHAPRRQRAAAHFLANQFIADIPRPNAHVHRLPSRQRWPAPGVPNLLRAVHRGEHRVRALPELRSAPCATDATVGGVRLDGGAVPGRRGRRHHVGRAGQLRGVHFPTRPAGPLPGPRPRRRHFAVPRLAVDLLVACHRRLCCLRRPLLLHAGDMPLHRRERVGPPPHSLPHAVADM